MEIAITSGRVTSWRGPSTNGSRAKIAVALGVGLPSLLKETIAFVSKTDQGAGQTRGRARLPCFRPMQEKSYDRQMSVFSWSGCGHDAQRLGGAPEANTGDSPDISCSISGCSGFGVTKPTWAMYDKLFFGKHKAIHNTRHSEKQLLVLLVNVDLSKTCAVGRWVADAFFLRVH